MVSLAGRSILRQTTATLWTTLGKFESPIGKARMSQLPATGGGHVKHAERVSLVENTAFGLIRADSVSVIWTSRFGRMEVRERSFTLGDGL